MSFSILLDRSDSTRGGKLEHAKAAAQLVMETLRTGSKFLYVPFDASWPSDCRFTLNREEIEQQIAATRMGKGTAAYDVSLARWTGSKGQGTAGRQCS